MTDPRYITEHMSVELRAPVLIAAFRGWNDAGEAASFAAMQLGQKWRATKSASIEPEEFYDFQAVRPQVTLIDGVTREIVWPANDFWAAHLEHDRDALILVGHEPNLRWRTFSSLVLDVAKRQGVEMVITLGALLADVPHSRPVPITGTAISQSLIDRLGLQRSRYEGPTGIVGVLHDQFGAAGIDSASLWAAVPHYLGVSPNPKAALALVRKTTELLGVPVDVDDLQSATETYEEKVAEIVSADEDVQQYVKLLEERADERTREEAIDATQIPSGESLAAELERYLREQGGDDRP